jgi:hypothetical protein
VASPGGVGKEEVLTVIVSVAEVSPPLVSQALTTTVCCPEEAAKVVSNIPLVSVLWTTRTLSR